MTNKFSCFLTQKGRWLTATLFLLFSLGIGQIWADVTYYMQTPGASTAAFTGDFYTTATLGQDVTCSYDDVDYKKAIKFGSVSSSWGNHTYTDRVIRYDCRTNKTVFTVVTYSTNASKKVYLGHATEGALGSDGTRSSFTSETTNANAIKTHTYTVEANNPSSFYVGVDNNAVYIVQIIAVEKGAVTFPRPGADGYSLNFKKGRVNARSGAASIIDGTATADGIEIHQNQNYEPGSTGTAKLQTNNTNYIKFTVAEKIVLSFVTSSTNQYTVGAKGKNTDKITPVANKAQLITIPSAGTYYINPQGSNITPTSMAFDIPVITYNKNNVDAEGTMSTNTWTVADNGFTAPEGKEFKEWNNKADGTGDAIAVGAEMLTDTTLYAIWQTPAAPASAEPTISAQPSTSTAQYIKDATATALSVTATGSGEVTYQWYSNTTASNADGTIIDGATSASYTPSTAAVGTLYYYCAVTNTETSKSGTTINSYVSGAIRTVAAPTHLVENVMATSGNWDSYIVSANAHISNLKTIAASEGKTLIQSGKETASSPRTPGITSNSSTTLVESDYIYLQFTIESGYELEVSAVSVPVFSISNTGKYVARISDNAGTPHIITTAETSVAQSADGDPFNGYDFSTSPKLTGTVTMKLFAYGWSNGYRMKSPVYIDGTISEVDVTAPTLSSSVPTNSATGIDVSGNIVLTMSENVTIADASKFSLTGGTGSLTIADISVSGAVITIPYTGLANNTDYTFTAAAGAIKDGSNNLNAAFTIDFKTAASGVCVKPDAPEDLGVEVKTNNYAKFIWDNGTAGANGYEIALTSEAVGATGKFDWKDEDDVIFEATGLTPETEYTFKVKHKGTVDDCYSDEVTTTFTTYAACTKLVPETSGDSPSAIGEEIRLQGGSTGGKIYVADNKAGKTLAESFTYTANGISLNTGGQDSLRVELSSLMKVGTVISAEIYNANDDKARGLLLKNMSKTTKATWTATMTGTHYETYTVVAGDGLEGSNMFLLSRSETAALKSLTVSNCGAALYDVTFDMKDHGTQVAKQKLTAGAKVTEPAEPEAAGYIFGGWYKETTLENAWNFSTDVVPANDMTLYAKWTADPCPTPSSIVKVVLTAYNDADVTGENSGEYAGGKILNNLSNNSSNKSVEDLGDGNVTGYKLAATNSAVFATLSKGTFHVGDRVVFGLTTAASSNKLAIYVAKDVANVVKLTEIDASAKGYYTYRLTAADIAAITAAGEGYMSIGSIRGDYNPYIYSVELKGCREWSTYHTLTFKNADGSATLASESLAEGAYASTIAPAAPRIKGKRFLGWSESVGGDVVNINEYTITEDKILYIVYEDVDCPTSGTIYKFQLKTGLADETLGISDNKDMSEYVNASGDGYLTYTSAANNYAVITTDSLIQMKNTVAYLKVDLDCALTAGDRIRVRCYNNPIRVQVGTTYEASKDLEFAKNDFGWQDVTASMVGKSDLYITRASNGNANLAYVEIYRRPALTGVTMDDMRLKIGKTGTPVLHLLPADDAIVTSQAWEITASTATGTIINAETGLITAGTATGVMTVKVTLNGDKEATATVTIVQGFEAPVPVSATTVWNWSTLSIPSGDGPTISAPDTVLANYLSGAGLENLAGNVGGRPYRSSTYQAYQGTSLYFKTTVPGILTINGTYTSSNKKVYVNGIEVGTVTGSRADLSKIVVPAGDVYITSEAMRIYWMKFDTDLAACSLSDNLLGGYTRDVTEGRYGTICLPKAGVMVGASIYTLAYYGETSQKFFFDEVVSGEMEAGKPYLFLPNENIDRIGVYYTGTATEDAQTVNGFVGYIGASADDYIPVPNNGYCYIIQNNLYRQVLNGAVAYILSNRAYINMMGATNIEPAKAPGARRIGLGVQGTQVATDIQDVEGNEVQCIKVMINGQIFILRGEKLYDATGRLVK